MNPNYTPPYGWTIKQFVIDMWNCAAVASAVIVILPAYFVGYYVSAICLGLREGWRAGKDFDRPVSEWNQR